MLKRFAFTLATMALAFGLVEGAARIALLVVPSAPDATAAEDPGRAAARAERLRDIGAANLLHPYLGFTSKPPEPRSQEARVPGEFVVAIFGGSVAERFGDSPHAARAFEGVTGGRPLRIVNLGARGHKQPQQLIALTYTLALGARFDLVFLLDGFNDVALAPAENVPRGVSPLYPRAWGLLLADLDANPQVRRLMAEVAFMERARDSASRWEGTRLGVVALGARLTVRAVDARLERLRTQLGAARLAASEDYQATGPTWAAEGDELYAMLATLWRDSSLQMAKLSAANGARFVHALQPNQRAGAKPMGPEERSVALRLSRYAEHASKGYPLLRLAGAELAARGIEFVDLTAAFDDTAEALYVDSCCHWSVKGEEILAQKIAAALAAAEDSSTHAGPDRSDRATAAPRAGF